MKAHASLFKYVIRQYISKHLLFVYVDEDKS